MKPIKALSLIILTAFLVCSCNTKKKNMEQNNSRDQDMIVKGYTKGTIHYSDKEGDCPYQIIISTGENSLLYYDPINLSERFKQDKAIVFFKFRGLRMMNRCPRATPIEVTEMELSN